MQGRNYDPSVALSSDGSMLAVMSEGGDRNVVVWEVPGGSRIVDVSHFPGTLGAVAFGPEDRTLLTAGADGTARLWDVATGTEILALEGHAGVVEEAEFGPTGDVIATGGSDGTVRLWDASSGEMLLVLDGGDGLVVDVSFSPDGSMLASGSTGVTRIWALDVGDLIDMAQRRLTRGFTEAECVTYHIADCTG